MLPAIAEIVLVQELHAPRGQSVVNAGLRRVGHALVPVGIAVRTEGGVVRLVVRHELVQVRIQPVRHDLDDVVQLGQRDVAANRKTPPNARLNLAEADLQLVDGVRAGCS